MSYLFAHCLRRCRGPFEFCAFVCVGHPTNEYLFRVGVPDPENEVPPCRGCNVRPRGVVLHPCAHLCICNQCLMNLGVDPRCPQCDTPVTNFRQVTLGEDMFNYDRVLYSSPEEAAAAQTLYKFFLRYTRYFTYPAQAPSPSARTGLTVTHHT